MINNRIRNLAPIIKGILETRPTTRSSDSELYLEYLKCCGLTATISIGYAMHLISEKKIASFESVGRCRRKAQELYPELRACESVRRARIDAEEPYEDFAQDKRI